MTGSCWRLLATLLWIFVCASVRAQEPADLRPFVAPNWHTSPSYTAPVWREWPPLTPAWPRSRPVPPASGAFGLMVRAAGIIFSGRVTSIGHTDNFPGRDPSSTMVTFQVDQAIRGAVPGQDLMIREWAGLWTGGEHYRVGERVLLFLYSPSKLGLTSPVAGAMGRFAINSKGMIVMSSQHVATLAKDRFLGGKTIVPYIDFVRAVERSRGEE